MRGLLTYKVTELGVHMSKVFAKLPLLASELHCLPASWQRRGSGEAGEVAAVGGPPYQYRMPWKQKLSAMVGRNPLEAACH